MPYSTVPERIAGGQVHGSSRVSRREFDWTVDTLKRLALNSVVAKRLRVRVR